MSKLTPNDSKDEPSNPSHRQEHPSQGQWVEWLYGECGRREHAKLEVHLAQCGECRSQVERWQSVMQTLNTGVLPKPQAAWPVLSPLFKWAAAAVLVLGLGFTLGRWTSHSERQLAAMRQQLQAEWKNELRQTQAQLRNELAARQKDANTELSSQINQETQLTLEAYLKQFSREYDWSRQTELAWFIDRVQAMENQRTSDNNSIRKDLETVAVTAEGEILKTRRQLGNLVLLTGLSQAPANAGGAPN